MGIGTGQQLQEILKRKYYEYKYLKLNNITHSFSIIENSTSTKRQLLDNETQAHRKQILERNRIPSFTWGQWGPWSPCSTTCGGGVTTQERKCLSSDTNRWNRGRRRRRRLTRSGTTVPLTQNNQTKCIGLDRRFHECNTMPCREPVSDHRAKQCSKYDRRPFRGKYYNWLPYVEGSSPCVLNCRPVGHQFYASLGLVADGTPCTKPPYKAVCIRGQCKVVGHEGVLSTSNSKQLRCGNRLVTGLFTTPHLPLGYSYITTVPTGACRLNITELQPSENYIALKVSNGSFIMNGGFAVSSPGSYEAVGAQFTYVRTAGVAESIYTAGPIHRPLDIMILYRHPYPVIKYEYFTDITIEDEKQNEIERTQQKQKHHNNDLPQAGATETAAHPNLDVFQRRFSYKSVGYTKCTKTCGGGIQVTKWKCLEEVTNAEASSTQCPGDPPPARRRHCNTHPCAGKWRLGIWSDCPKCGPAESVRKVTCIKEHSRSITPVKDAECDGQKPITSRRCDIPNCDSIKQERDDLPTMVNARRQARPKIESFQDKPVIYTQDNATKYDSNEIPSISSFKTGDSIFGEWLHSDWTECMGWCGNGVRSRNVVCSSSSGKCMNPEPAAYESCSIRAQCQPATPQPLWLTGPWSQCSSPCSWGRRVRVVVCASSLGRRLRDSACLTLPKPLTVESCRASGICSDDWIVGEWSECPCRAQGDVSTQRRTVRCNGHTCTSSKPIQVRACDVGSTCPINQLSPPISQTPGRPTPVLPTPITDIPRTTRNEIPFKAQTSTSTSTELNLNDGSCENKLTSCSLAVQARLCQYPYYVKYCCRSCKNAIP